MTSHSKQALRDYKQATNQCHHTHVETHDQESISTPTTSSTLTSARCSKSSTDIQENSKVQKILDIVETDMFNLRETMTTMELTIQTLTDNTTEKLQQIGTHCNKQIDSLKTEQHQCMQDIGASLSQQIQQEQNKTTSILKTMLLERDASLETDLQTQFELLLSKLNVQTSMFPARKKPTSSTQDNITATTDTNRAISNLDNQQQTPTIPTENITINPYYHNTMRRRSVHNTLPTFES
jgi:hypothetical protein